MSGDKIIIEFDARKRDHHKIFKLKRGVRIRSINERAVQAQELSGFAWPIIYRITTGDGYYLNGQSQRVYFTPEVAGLSMRRRASEVVLGLGIFLCIVAGFGARQASLRSTISKISFGKPSFSIAKYGQSRNYFIAVREIFWRKPDLLKTTASAM